MDACLVFWSEMPAKEAVNWLRGVAAGVMRQHRSEPNGSIRGGMAVEVEQPYGCLPSEAWISFRDASPSFDNFLETQLVSRARKQYLLCLPYTTHSDSSL